MKRLLMIMTTLCVLLGGAVAAAPERYLLQTDRSEVGFIFQINGTANRGTMPVIAADISIDFDQFTNSQVDVTLDASGARTGLIFATEALKAASMLDVRNHPAIRFQSTAVRVADPRNLSQGGQIDGLLTIRGVTRPVTLNVALFRQEGTADGDLRQLSFRISGTIRRGDFNAAGYADMVADVIELDIAARVIRAQ